MEELNICEKLVKVLPEGAWCDNNFPGCVWYDGATIRPELPDDTDHNCWFINWALDELAKTGRQPHIGVFPNIHTMENMWYVKWTPRGIEDVAQTNQHPTKTLALAHALIEVSRG